MKILKKVILPLVAVILSVTLCSCDNGNGTQSTTEDTAITMPDLKNMTESEARTKYPQFVFTVEQSFSSTVDEGKIISQSVKSGEKTEKTAEITITVSKGVKLVEIEDLSRYTLDDAQKILESHGMYCETVRVESNTIAEGFVVSTDPEAHTNVCEGTFITIYVSSGSPTSSSSGKTKVPDFAEKTEDEAVLLAKEAELTLIPSYEYNDETEKNHVISQDIDPDEEVEKGTDINVVISMGAAPLSSSTLSLTIDEKATGKFTFNYYIDGKLQSNLTEIRDVSISKTINWTVSGDGKVKFKIEVVSADTSKKGTFAEYTIDFSKETPKQTKIKLDSDIFLDLSA